MSRRTQDPPKLHTHFAYGALTLFRSPSQMILLCLFLPYWSPTTPVCMHTGLGSSRFARRYSGNRFFFLFLQVLRCFSSLRLPRFRVTVHNDCWVPPFGNLWINAYLQLPKAYRCSSRPSSAPSAKAFTVRPLFLNHIFALILTYRLLLGLAFLFYISIDSVNSRFIISFLFEIIMLVLLTNSH